MKILITGGAGFIGSHLVDRLLADDNEITVVDGHNLRIRVIDDFSHGKYANLPVDPRLRVYDADILSDRIHSLFEGVDFVYHLAALTRPQWSLAHPVETDQVNVLGTVKLLENCVKHKVKRVVFLSTSDLYGDQEQYPTPEDVIPNPLNFYALSKLLGEKYCALFSKIYGLEYNIVRPFNVYGSRMPLTGIYTSAIATFINVIKNDLPLKTFGTGEQRRDFVHVEDLVDLLVLLSTSEVKNEAFNCGFGKNYSINEVHNLISEIMNKRIEPERLPGQFEKKMTLADMTKLNTLLNWKPKYDLKEGLERTINE